MSENKDGPASHKPGHGGHEEEHEEHVNHEAWVIPYADMLTLLMALFLMLWATSNVDQDKFAALSESLRDAFGNGTGESQGVLAGAPGIMTGQESGVENGDMDRAPKIPDPGEMARAALAAPGGGAQAALERENARNEEQLRENATMNSVQKKIAEKANSEGVLEALEFKREERGLVVTVVADDVLFDPGSAALKPQGERIVSVVTEALKNVPNDIMVEGHTDNSPIANERFPSNWELSSGRGTSVLRFMTDRIGIPGGRLASAGYGDTQPVATNDSLEGRSENRRVEIVVLSAL